MIVMVEELKNGHAVVNAACARQAEKKSARWRKERRRQGDAQNGQHCEPGV